MKINERSELFNARFTQRALVRALQEGTEGMIAGNFLIKELAEEDEEFNQKKQYAVLTNYTDEFVNTLVGRATRKKSSFEVDEERHQEKLQEFLNNITLDNESIHDLVRNMLEVGIWNGYAAILVDKDRVTGTPYINLIHPDSILGIDYDENGDMVLFRVIEYVNKRIDRIEFKTVERVRLFEKVDGKWIWELYEQDTEKQDEFNIIDSGDFGTDYLPLYCFYAGAKAGLFDAKPVVKTLSELNKSHFNIRTNMLNSSRYTANPILFGKHKVDDNGEFPMRLRIGASQMVAATDETADLKYIEHTGAATGSLRNILIDLKEEMVHTGVDFLAINRSLTATGATLSAEGNNSKLSAIVSNLASCLDAALTAMFDMIGIDVDVKTIMNTDFGANVTAEQISALMELRRLGDISHEFFMRELKRYGLLDPSFDLLENKEQIEQDPFK